MNQPIGRQAQQIIYKVHKFFEERKKDTSSLEYQNDINLAKTVSEAIGVSSTTIRKIVSNGKVMEAQDGTVQFKSPKKNLFPKKRLQIDTFTEGVIRRKAQFYSIKKVIPTLRKLKADLQQDNILHCSHEYLRQTLRRLGFKFLTCQSKRKLLIERYDIMSLRWHYIRDIKKYRNEGRSIIFLDETYVNECHRVSKCWQSKEERGAMKNIGKGPRLIIVHAVVIDNAAYHSTVLEKKPIMRTLKIEMQQWLERRNIPFDMSSRKCDLMKIIDGHNVEKQFMIDEIIKAKGHTVLRLPPYHPDLNPIELVWGDIKGELARTAVNTKLKKKKEILQLLFSNYTPEKWSKCDDHVIKNENEYYASDRVFDDEFDRLVIALNEGDDDDEESEEEEGEESESDVDWDNYL
ncbi:hypothetical protein EVAR_10296_1 [Eumeta japonica]|uniref:Tc1-like transposase DDE domain-containing protein n=1 Tax=Eumeta variegata TaxID=151549 RepID=A0A4C1TER9_EUMVA|nr:hypothetical protein EVAR_10296_1 [Eumeta japonica]